jgi:hypothetical protein
MYKPTHDLRVPMLGRDCKMEIKCRGDGFATLYRWLVPVDVLVLKADRKEALAVMPLTTLIELIKKGESK